MDASASFLDGITLHQSLLRRVVPLCTVTGQYSLTEKILSLLHRIE